jgi:hypothetical protein
MESNASAASQPFFERELIREVVDGIDNAVDRKDWARCRSYFSNEIYVDFTSLAGGEPGRMPADDLIEAWRSNLPSEKPTLHLRTNHEYRIDGDSAEVESKAHATNLLRRELGEDWWDVFGWYTHTLSRDGSGWTCTGMTFAALHGRGNELVRQLNGNPK